MTLLSSLRGRIFLASALLAVLSIGVAIYLVNARVTNEAEGALQREILSTGALVDQLRATRTQTFTVMARLIADLPKLKAAVETNDPPTVQDIAVGYQDQLKSNLLLIQNGSGQVLATVGSAPRAAKMVTDPPAVREALGGRERVSLLPQPDGILQVVSVPIAIGLTQPQMLGTLSVGFLLDDGFASQLKEITGSDIAFGMDGRILAATRPREEYAALADRLRTSGISVVRLGAQEYLALPRPLASTEDGATSGAAVALILRSRTEQLRLLQAIRTGLAATAVFAVLLATLLSFAVARTITRPLAAITDVMREVAATGDLTRKIAVREGRRWEEDEDARLLATTFNTLTDSIARFQREISQKERLSSLGRLSTVIAHEVRNPLMIIKASLHTLGRPDVSPDAIGDAVADIDEEVARLNRIVNEVLDFARPIRFELAPTDVNALCRESVAASQAAVPGAPVHFDLDPAAPVLSTDPERLRIALVNMLVNARHAVNGASTLRQAQGRPERGRGTNAAFAGSGLHDAVGPVPPPAPERSDPPELLISLKTHTNATRTTIVIADRGVGIDAADLPRVFDPYFTTKRGGTGLGLAIAKNIVEGLGGTIVVASTPGRGTEIRIDLPTTSVAGADRSPH
jgi:signal transduction histidine kinase